MPPTKTPLPVTHPRLWVLWLGVAHGVLGWSVGGVLLLSRGDRFPDLLLGVLIGIVFSETTLLGIWGGLGTLAWPIRLLTAAGGASYLAVMLGFCADGPDGETFCVVFLATALVTGALLVVRCFRVRLGRSEQAAGSTFRLQFSIRQLMILTFAVACLAALGRWLGPRVVTLRAPVLLILVALELAAVGLMSIWPMLGMRHPFRYGPLVVGAGAGIGYCFARLVPPYAFVVGFWTTIATAESLSLVVSLLVLRRAGYRLVRLPPATERPASPGPAAGPGRPSP